jgi:hypothetical protein
MATKQPGLVKAMVLVSATSYFSVQARKIMEHYATTLPEQQLEILRRTHPGGDPQIQSILASTRPSQPATTP